MKKLTNPIVSANQINIALLLTRIGIALLMLTHGVPKLQQLLADEPVQFISFLGLSASVSLTLAMFAEAICSVAILLGFFTRLATIPLLITMLVAVLHIHSNDPFIKQELGLHYIIVYVLLLITGAGKYSMDALIHQKS